MGIDSVSSSTGAVLAAAPTVATSDVLSGEPSAASYPVISVVDVADSGAVTVWHVLTGPSAVTGRVDGAWIFSSCEQPAARECSAAESGVSAQGTAVGVSQEPSVSAPGDDQCDGALFSVGDATAGDGRDTAVPGDLDAAVAADCSRTNVATDTGTVGQAAADTGDEEFPADERSESEKLASVVTGTVVVAAVPLSVEEHPWVAAADARATVADCEKVIADSMAELRASVADFYATKTAKQRENMPVFTTPTIGDPGDFIGQFHGDETVRACWCLTRGVVRCVDQWMAVESARRSRSWLKDIFGAQVRPLPLPR